MVLCLLLELTGLFLNHPVMAQHGKDFFERVFSLFSALRLNLTGLMFSVLSVPESSRPRFRIYS